MQWRWILPVAGLALFLLQSYDSLRKQPHFGRYFYWFTLRLDSDPQNKSRPKEPPDTPCRSDNEPCTGWVDEKFGVQPDWPRVLPILSALPAFICSWAIILALSRFGVSEILAFMTSMPVLIFVWYYFLGWLVDRSRIRKFASRSKLP
jgi:hypothetical protein